MQLNTPPPGADRAPEILPAVLHSPGPIRRRPSGPSTPASSTDALGAVLRTSRCWEDTDTVVTETVTLTSWLLLVLDVTAVFVTWAVRGRSDIFARILTWNDHPGAVLTVTVTAALIMAATATATRALRRANLLWLRVWVGGAVASVAALAAMAVALVVGVGLAIAGVLVAIVVIGFVLLIAVGVAGAFGG